MIRFEISTESPVAFVAFRVGEHVKVIRNPALTASLPFWIQDLMLNEALAEAAPPPRKRRQRPPAAEVISIVELREQRDARVAFHKVQGRGT